MSDSGAGRISRWRDRPRALASYLLAFGLALAIPPTLYAGYITVRFAQSERAQLQRHAQDAERAILVAIERELAAHIGSLQALATSPAVFASDLSDFYMQALVLARVQGSQIVLRDLTGRQFVNSRVVWGTFLPTEKLTRTDAQVIATKEPGISDLTVSAVTREPAVQVSVPILQGDEVMLLLTANLPVTRLRDVIEQQAIREPYYSSVVDRGGLILARSVRSEEFTGKKLSGFDELTGVSGEWSGINAEGVPILGVYERSSLTGWTIGVGLAQAAISAPLHRSLYMLGGLAVVLSLVALTLAWLLSRQLAGSVRALTNLAFDLRGGRVGALPRLPIRELNIVAKALSMASEGLHERDERLERANRDLEQRVTERTSELAAKTALLDATLENMDQGLFMIDAAGIVQVCNQRAMDLLELPPELMRSKPTFESIRRYQLEQDEFVNATPDMQQWAETRGVAEMPYVYERERPNGTVLEVRTVPLGNGGAVRTYTDITARKEYEVAVVESEERYRALADALPQMVWVLRPNEGGRAVYMNKSFREFYGDIGPSREARVTRNHPEDAERITAAWEAAHAREELFEVEGRLRRHDGVYRWHKLVMIPIPREGGAVEWLGTALDTDDIVTARQKLEESTELLRLAQKAAGAGVWEWDIGRGVTRLSPDSAKLYGLDSASGLIELTSSEWAALIHPEDAASARVAAQQAVDTRSTYSTEFRVASDGNVRWLHSMGRPVFDDGGRPIRMVGLDLDVTARKEAERRAEHMARHDALTTLPNRVLFREHLDQKLAEARSNGGALAVLCMDLDRFKTVNDSLGHPVGDALLCEAGRRLRAIVRAEDTVARLGGDEFSVLYSSQSGLDAERDLRCLADRLISRMSEPFLLDGGRHRVTVGTSIGIALAPRDGFNPDEVFKKADLALYRAKAEGRSTFRFYASEMDAAVEERRRLELDLRGALARSEFEVQYQPILEIATGRVCAFEALVRWHHPVRGLLLPNEFIPLCEETGLITGLGEWVLREACATAASWDRPDLRIAVNISAVQFRNDGLVRSVASALTASGLQPNRLEVEITETVLMEDAEEVTSSLHRLRALGVRVALDDFGTGYSSLSYLRRFPFDKIKIDRSFIAALADVDTAAIVRAIVSLGNRLGATITAEGVESREQLELLRAEGCAEVQGYLVSPPLPPKSAIGFLLNQSSATRALSAA